MKAKILGLLLILSLSACRAGTAELELALKLMESNYTTYVEDLAKLVSIPTVSALPENLKDIRHAAEWLVERLNRAGMKNIEILETEGPRPVVYADWKSSYEGEEDPNRITAIIYGHYDVQPVDPLDEWESPPFELTTKLGALYGRGTDDDKGGILMAIHAVEAMLATAGSLPVDVKFLLEGEEELMSPNLKPFLESHRELLAADLVLSADGGQISETQGAIGLGLRGVMGAEISVTTAGSDMHSGVRGGSVANPNMVLAQILSSLQDLGTGKVLVPGFYEGVEEPSAEDKADIASMNFDEEAEMRDMGVTVQFGEKGYSMLERRWFRPTLEVVGMHGGFTGEGIKTVIPRQASAKLSCRLVAGQDPADIFEKIEKHVVAQAPPFAKVVVSPLGGRSKAYSVAKQTPGNRAAAKVLEQVYGTPPKFYRRGATIPALSSFGPILGLPVTAFGWGLGDHIHAPNERLSEVMYAAGHKAWAMLLTELGMNYEKKDFHQGGEGKEEGGGGESAEGGGGVRGANEVQKEEL